MWHMHSLLVFLFLLLKRLFTLLEVQSILAIAGISVNSKIKFRRLIYPIYKTSFSS